MRKVGDTWQPLVLSNYKIHLGACCQFFKIIFPLVLVLHRPWLCSLVSQFLLQFIFLFT